MAKVKQPLLSLDARRKLGDDIVFKRQGRTAIVETRPIPIDARSVGQLSWRHMFQKVVALWHALSAAEKETWESAARSRHMTGYAWFVSQALRPNPGIYLPLQGGTMTGDIDMAKHRLLRLPLPVDGQEPVSLTYFNDNLPAPEEATKEFFVPIFDAVDMGSTGAILNGADDLCDIMMLVPQDFTSLTSIELILRPNETGASMHIYVYTRYGAYNGGEDFNVHTEEVAGRDIGETTNKENLAHSISDLVDVAALAAGDLVTVRVAYDATAVNTNLVVRGIRLKYS